MHPKLQRFLAPLLVVSLLLAAFCLSLGVYGPAAAQQPVQDDQAGPAKTSTEAALKKLTPKLREAAKTGGDQLINIRIDSDRAVDVSRYAVQAVSGDPQPLGEVITLARVKPSALLKIAALPGVARLSSVEPEITARPDLDRERRPVPSVAERRERYNKLMRTDRAWDPAAEPDALRTPADWWDIRAGHQSQRAWTKGYRGDGVKVAVIDSGTDMAHPDMLGTWAVITDTASPYYGWPIAYDPFSMLLYLNDANFGTDYVAAGYTWYVDTSATPPVTRSEDDIANGTAHVKYAPFRHTTGRGRKEPGDQHDYKVNDTSKSGVYHIGSHPDRWISEVYGEHMAVLLVDEQQSGVYDIVYVDLDNDYDFTDEKPVTRDSPASYRDMDGDGFADLSGGVVYFIANGTARIPGSNVLYGNALARAPARAGLVAFMGTFDPDGGGDHGNLCGSNIVAQGRINGDAPPFIDLPGDGRPQGMTFGSAPGASLIAVGDIYYNFDTSTLDAYLLTMLGYDGRGGTPDDAQISSNSYGDSDIDNDGWDYKSRYVDRYVRRLNPTYTYMDSTGNGAPGAGTSTPNSPAVGIGVGASTQYGSTDWDSITRTTQIQSGNVTSFSNRGPGGRGTAGVDVVANGDRGAGAALVNVTLNGATAWETWGGTSRSTPVAAGNMALVYQAFRQRAGRWPRYDEARAILKSGAVSSGQDVMAQGAGVVNADYATDIASGRQGVYALPDEWNPGDYRGREYPAFANIIHAGASDTQSFSLSNPSASPVDVHLSATVLRRFESREFSFTSQASTEETPYSFIAPDYLFPVNNVPESAELMVVTMRYPYQQHDGNGDYTEDQQWRLLIYDWTDINGDGKLWDDRDGDGHVDKTLASPPQFTHDGHLKLDWSQSELQPWEYVRTMYTRPYGNIMQVNQAFPAQRMSDGLFIGLQHTARSAAVPTTTMQIRVEFFKREDWPWVSFTSEHVTIAPRSTVTATATITIPANTAAGIYQGAIYATYAGQAPYRVFLPYITSAHEREGKTATPTQMGAGYPDRRLTIPVVASVAERFDFTGALTFGGSRAYDPNVTYNNGAVSGWFDWSWRPESGDWRFFFFDATQAPEPGTKYLTRNVWSDNGPPTDVDTLLLGPTSDRFSDPNNPGNTSSNWADPDFYGPYTLDDVGKSPNTYLGSGRWRFQTATGGAEEWVTGAAREGLHLMMLHNVLLSGAQYAAPFTATLGVAKVNPAAINITGAVQAGNVISDCLPLTFSSTLDLPGLSADGFGLSQPENLTDQVARQDDPDDPSSATYKRALTLSHAASLNINVDVGDNDDLDLFLVYDADDDGTFELSEIVASSEGGSGDDEAVALRAPRDGAYQIWVLGWEVPGASTTFDMVIDAVQGRDLTVRGLPSGPLPANTVANLQVCYQKTAQPGDVFKGEVLVGPSVAPSALSIPVRIAIPVGVAQQK